MTVVLDGKGIAKSIEIELAARSRILRARGLVPALAFVQFGADEASAVYARRIATVAARIGVRADFHGLPADTSREAADATIARLNADREVHGILVERPLPGALGDDAVLQAIDPGKDVDGVTFAQVGRMVTEDRTALAPCTPLAVLELLRRSGRPPRGKHVVVLGRSATVGRPLSILLGRKDPLGDATVTLCHGSTLNLERHTLAADVIVSAIGKAGFLKRHHVREDAVVIDVGVSLEVPSRVAGGRASVIRGDADYDELFGHCAAITPVPGGVGPITVTMLFRNLLAAACQLTGTPKS